MDTSGIASPTISTETPHLRKPFYKSPICHKDLDETDLHKIDSSASMPKKTQRQPKRLVSTQTEKILEWWIGTVLEVHDKEGYFEARLEDSEGIKSIAEFDVDTELKQDVFPKARFVFSVFTKYGQGSPETANRIEFIPPHIWTKEEKKEMKEIYRELFPKGPSLLD